MGSTPNRRVVLPADTPAAIAEAIRAAELTRFCRFTTDLHKQRGHYSIEALIGPDRWALHEPEPPWYRVRFFLWPTFPHRRVETVPLEPALVWNPHQNGDWGEDAWKRGVVPNALCPPRASEIAFDQLLHPYIRHAYRWIRDAHNDNLVHNGERYELPHVVNLATGVGAIYTEASPIMAAWLRQAKFGLLDLVRLTRFADPACPVLRVRSLSGIGGKERTTWRSACTAHCLGIEEDGGFGAWVFAGVLPTVAPHRPPLEFTDLTEATREHALRAIEQLCEKPNPRNLLLLAFLIPRTWGTDATELVWLASQVSSIDPKIFRADRKGFRPSVPLRNRPRGNALLQNSSPIAWLKCTDMSEDAIKKRGGPEIAAISQHRIAVVGAGALGSVVASAIARLYPEALVLIDKETIEPGNLVRHEAMGFQTGDPKADAVALLVGRPGLNEVTPLHQDVVNDWETVKSKLAACSLILDLTADAAVHDLLETAPETRDVHLAIGYVKPGPSFGLLFLRQKNSSRTLNAAHDVLRVGLSKELWDRFVDSGAGPAGALVWPQPGCYEPTFQAPYYRMRMMADSFVATLIAWITAGATSDLITLFSQESAEGLLGIETRIAKQTTMGT